eukprot:TRINITY_DN2444_c1_g2_i1.p1 TRINITY_DN2444_c1_g2~~TRINITY_DN2444_c1_g2_i1.p1  ORF type:complete len:397 (-),score=57.20 TRINITY_DN2444_c1_g2_i1:37-1227(-)
MSSPSKDSASSFSTVATVSSASAAVQLPLLLAIAGSWVGVAQLARAAESSCEQSQHRSVTPLVTWANATAWMVLAAPHGFRRLRDRPTSPSTGADAAAEAVRGPSKWLRQLCWPLRTSAFRPVDSARFLALALSTNYCYVGALHYLPASMNTAVFCTSPVFTLVLSLICLREGGPEMEASAVAAVLLSVFGVVLIAEPWQQGGSSGIDSASVSGACAGVGLSLLAALGTALYQVGFKMTFGDRLRADEVGLFLAYMGGLTFIFFGSFLAVLDLQGVYPLNLWLVPWGLVLATAACSAIFNFLIKFGIITGAPVSVSLATQVGIPLNLFLDVVVVRVPISASQICGLLVMLLSFTLQQTGNSNLRRPSCAAGLLAPTRIARGRPGDSMAAQLVPDGA